MKTTLFFTTLLLTTSALSAHTYAQSFGVSASGSATAFLGDIPNDSHSYNQPLIQQLSYSNEVQAHVADSYALPCGTNIGTGTHSSDGVAAGSVSMGLFSGTTNATLSRSPVSYICNSQTITNTASSQAGCNAALEFDDMLTLTSSSLPPGTVVPFRITVVCVGSLTQGASQEYASPEYTPSIQLFVSTNYFNPGTISLAANKASGFFNGAYSTDTQHGTGASFNLQATLTYGMSTFYLESGFASASTDERINSIAVYVDPLIPGVHVLSASGHDYSTPAHCSADFNGDGDIGTDSDIEAFFACLAGTCCSTCESADFNGDGDVGTDADIESFFRVLAGGPC